MSMSYDESFCYPSCSMPYLLQINSQSICILELNGLGKNVSRIFGAFNYFTGLIENDKLGFHSRESDTFLFGCVPRNYSSTKSKYISAHRFFFISPIDSICITEFFQYYCVLIIMQRNSF